MALLPCSSDGPDGRFRRFVSAWFCQSSVYIQKNNSRFHIYSPYLSFMCNRFHKNGITFVFSMQQFSFGNLIQNQLSVFGIPFEKTGNLLQTQKKRSFLLKRRFFHPFYYLSMGAFNFSAKFFMASEIFSCCGQTASQLWHPIQ